MTGKAVYSQSHNAHLAEGQGKFAFGYEPASPLRTSSVPIVVMFDGDTANIASDSADTINPHAEGQESTDVQDAALNSGATAPQAITTATADGKNRQFRVLIVEDTTELGEVIQATLERLNILAVHETHGNKAMQKFNELNPDVVLLDISLPDTNGWKIMDTIKERLEETHGAMPKVIIITAYDDPANRLIGKLQGVHNYLIKPFTPDEIERLVREALGMTA